MKRMIEDPYRGYPGVNSSNEEEIIRLVKEAQRRRGRDDEDMELEFQNSYDRRNGFGN